MTAATLVTLAAGLGSLPAAFPGDASTHQFRRAARHLQAAALALFAALASLRAESARRRADRAVLMAMDAHELRDLGIGRGEIASWTATRPARRP
ncbi:DUF1127 domain-containing protein [Leptothrix discophora]|uniref:DUF1127 domain-containing protein n=1 Tax=Leptothrix discophora TaxID=89 RepID=A0ABT9G4T6_LEPDI|nr:DUF1127 domain-containing protein [Leptothrix discophora]MDP4301495.1 DUF1127 domain-containing protein [Leptothrix discophora]